MIAAVVVGVPACDEEDTIEECLSSIDRAAAQLDVPTVVVLAADRCSDETESRARRADLTSVRLDIVRGQWRAAGAARAAAIRHGLALCAAPHEETWIATTDADSVVADDWLVRQLAHAASGADAVAGIVELRDDHHCNDRVVTTFHSVYAVGELTHEHVHGANLGVRADWYAAAGGFAAVELSEDHLLWNELRRRGARCLPTIDGRVATSARLRGRAVGGFADTLRAAVEGAPA